MDMVALTVEPAQLGAELGTDLAHDPFAAGEDLVRERPPPALGGEDDAATSADIGVRLPTR
jgi:hypothetical protein